MGLSAPGTPLSGAGLGAGGLQPFPEPSLLSASRLLIAKAQGGGGRWSRRGIEVQHPQPGWGSEGLGGFSPTRDPPGKAPGPGRERGRAAPGRKQGELRACAAAGSGPRGATGGARSCSTAPGGPGPRPDLPLPTGSGTSRDHSPGAALPVPRVPGGGMGMDGTGGCRGVGRLFWPEEINRLTFLPS